MDWNLISKNQELNFLQQNFVTDLSAGFSLQICKNVAMLQNLKGYNPAMIMCKTAISKRCYVSH